MIATHEPSGQKLEGEIVDVIRERDVFILQLPGGPSKPLSLTWSEWSFARALPAGVGSVIRWKNSLDEDTFPSDVLLPEPLFSVAVLNESGWLWGSEVFAPEVLASLIAFEDWVEMIPKGVSE